MLLLVPADALRASRPDGHWAPEHAAARELGLDVALLDHDAAERGDAAAAVRRVPAAADVVYRGWMLSVGQYAALAAALAARGGDAAHRPGRLPRRPRAAELGRGVRRVDARLRRGVRLRTCRVRGGAG